MFFNECPMLSPVEANGCFGRMLVTFMVQGEGLPTPGIDFFEDFPLLTLAVAANFGLANSLQVPLEGLKIFTFVTGSLVLMLCLVLIL